MIEIDPMCDLVVISFLFIKKGWTALCAGRGGGEQVQERGDTTMNANNRGTV